VLAYAAELASNTGAKVTVLHVWECEPNVPPELIVHGADGKPRRLSEYVEEQARSGMADFLAGCSLPPGLAVEERLARGASAQAVLDEARRSRADLIVMGTHGRSGFKHLILGSVAEKVIREAPVPVLTVPESSSAPR
jgi:nucleotide-binding universal stress UspA family protein